jgi:hypothetical protein
VLGTLKEKEKPERHSIGFFSAVGAFTTKSINYKYVKKLISSIL